MKVLISCDYSRAAEHILREAKKFLADIEKTEIYIYCVVDASVISSTGLQNNADIVETMEMEAEEVHKWGQNIFEGQEVSFLTDIGYPAEKIVQKASDIKADLLILGTHGKTGINRLLIGSVAEKVLRHTYCNTLVIPIKHLVNG